MPSSLSLIASNTVTTPVASVTFSGISPSLYVNLLVVASVRSSTGPDRNSLESNTNNSTNYGYNFQRSYGSGTSGVGFVTNTAYGWGGILYHSGSTATPATGFSTYYIEYPGYANYGGTGQYKNMYFYGAMNTTTGSVLFQGNGTGSQLTTSATSSITIKDGNGANFTAGSTLYLYGKA
jgi:hypothetical protein